MSENPEAAKIKLWRERPDMMVRMLFGVEPDPWQDEALRAFPTTQRMAMSASKGPGKSCVLAWCAWNFLLTRPSPNIAATSISGDNLRDGLWKEMAVWREKSPLLKAMFDLQVERIFAKESPQTWFMSARSWSKTADANQLGNTLAGLHSDYILFILDESGSIPVPILLSAEAALSSCKEGHLIQAGNTNSLDGALYEACVRRKELWRVIQISGDPDDPKRSSRIGLDWAKEMVATYGRESPFVKVMVLGQWPAASTNALLGPEEVEAAFKQRYQQAHIDFFPRVLGVDVHGEGDDADVIFPRQGLVAFPPHILRGTSASIGAGQVARVWDDWDVDAVFIDNTGGWAGAWRETLKLMNRTPIPVGFAEASSDPQFANRRAEMYFRAADWVKTGGQLPETPELMAELTQTTYTYKGDQLILEPKKLIKAKIGRSPDRADALCLCAGTLIATPEGQAAIEALRTGDEVLTPFGVATIQRTWVSQTNRLTTARFSNGAELKGKPDHGVFVFSHGKVHLDTLPLTFAISPLSERGSWLKMSGWFIGVRSTGFKKLADTLAPASLSSVSAFCIGAFGLNITARSRKAVRSITRMMIGATALISETLSASVRRNMTLFTGLSVNGSAASMASPTLPANALLSGTVPRKGLPGMLRTEKRLGMGESRLKPSASAAENHFRPISRPEQSSVPKPAHKRPLIHATRQTLASVVGVTRRSWRTVTRNRYVVPISVQTASVPLTNVYNLTLDKDNAYYANGVLVFNCLTFAESLPPRKRGPTLPKSRQEDSTYDPFREWLTV